MTVHIEFNWFDFWIGAFYNRWGHRLYIQIVPMVTIVVQFRFKGPSPAYAWKGDK